MWITPWCFLQADELKKMSKELKKEYILLFLLICLAYQIQTRLQQKPLQPLKDVSKIFKTTSS